MTDDLVTRLNGLADCDSRAGEPLGKCMREAAARIEEQAATIARLEGERERLALAICGGEDAPGYANAQPVEALEKVARDNAAAAMWQIDRTMKAEAQVAALTQENADLIHDLERIKDSETAYLNASMQSEAKLSAIRALQAAPEGWDEVMATRALVMAKDAAQAQVAELKQEAGMFLALWAVRHAEMQGLADGEIHPQHYDRMAELGCRMDAFTRAAIAAAKEGA